MSDIVIHKLGKRYRSGWHSRWVLKDLKLTIGSGEVVGLIGASGAGKTTLFKLLAGYISPDAGYVRYVSPHKTLGQDPRLAETRKRLAYMPERPRFPAHLTAPQVLRYLAAAEGLSRSEAAGRIPGLLEQVALARHAQQRVADYSRGMVQRLALAQCFLGQPEVALLDEPFSGLDPQGRELTRRLIGELQRSGATVIFSSQLIADIEEGCTHLVVLREGKATKMPLAGLAEAPQSLKNYFDLCSGY